MNQSKYQKLYSSIKADIHSGKLKAGDKLPSKRSVCLNTGVSLTTATKAYETLVSEGLVISKERSGFFVANINGLFVPHHSTLSRLTADTSEQCDAPSGYITTMRKVLTAYPNIISIKPDNKGSLVLRKAIADFLYRYRNLSVMPDNIIIGSGAEELYGKIVLLLGREKTYAIENPCYKKIEKVYSDYGVKIDKIPLDNDGLNSIALNNSNASVLHVSPFHSYPSGVTASEEKRKEYLNWITDDKYLIEDDYDSEFYFGAIPQTLVAKNERILYLNTFSKSISPAIRIGYLVLPENLAEKYKKEFSTYTCPVPIFEQYVLATYISDGLFERHLNKKRLKMIKGGK